MQAIILTSLLATREWIVLACGSLVLLIGLWVAIKREGKARFIGLALALIGFVLVLTSVFILPLAR